MISLFLFFTTASKASDDYNFECTNKVYDEMIKTVTLETNNLPTNFPIMTLGKGEYIMLKFDDLLNDERNLYYKVIHCNKDWTISDLRDLDYLNGFNDERLRNYEYSVNTRKQYIHYWQQFPNKDLQFKVSGNYIILIYEDNVETPILTRRFIISENTAGIDITSIYPSDVLNIRYKQELQATVSLGKLKMRNPIEEVSLVMLQNENWSEAISSKASFFSGTNLRFNKLSTYQYWGLAEFREFDTRSLIRLGRNVEFIDRRVDGTDVLLQPDPSRSNKVHISIFDFNGRFFIENFERAGGNNNSDNILDQLNTIQSDPTVRQSLRDSLLSQINAGSRLIDGNASAEERNVRSDYTEVTFLLDASILLEDNQSIYILGGMNNYLPSEEYKMHYDGKRDMFTAQVLMKQGYYNYFYGIADESGKIDYQALEGSWNETENDYQAIIYYRGLGDLYDRVIGFRTYNTNSSLLRF